MCPKSNYSVSTRTVTIVSGVHVGPPVRPSIQMSLSKNICCASMFVCPRHGKQCTGLTIRPRMIRCDRGPEHGSVNGAQHAVPPRCPRPSRAPVSATHNPRRSFSVSYRAVKAVVATPWRWRTQGQSVPTIDSTERFAWKPLPPDAMSAIQSSSPRLFLLPGAGFISAVPAHSTQPSRKSRA